MTKFETGGSMRYAFGAAIVWIIVCGGCTTLGPTPPQPEWSCQAEADAAVSRNDWNAALELHQAFVQQAPDNCMAIYHLGYIWGKLGNRSSEAAQYERAIKCGYDRDDRLLFNLGMAYGELGRIREATEAFERAVGLNPASADNHFGLGLMHQEAGQIDRAVAAFSSALSVDDRYWDARLALCRILLDQGRLETARSHLEVLSKGMPDNEEVRRLWRLYERRRIMMYEP